MKASSDESGQVITIFGTSIIITLQYKILQCLYLQYPIAKCAIINRAPLNPKKDTSLRKVRMYFFDVLDHSKLAIDAKTFPTNRSPHFYKSCFVLTNATSIASSADEATLDGITP